MIKIHYALRRKAGMSFDDFPAYWRGPHAERVKSLAARRRIASAEDLARANIDPDATEAQQLLAEDEAKFIDIANSSIFFMAEHKVIG